MKSLPTIIALAIVQLATAGAVQKGIVERVDGIQLSGEINFSSAEVSVKTADGKTTKIPIAEFRSATLTKDPDAKVSDLDLPRNGLRGRYYSNIKHEDKPVERIDASISFDWGESAPMEGVRPNGFSVRWEGEIECPVSGEITFEVESDDGNRLWVDGKKLTDHWQAQNPTTHSGKIKLEAKRRYSIKLEFYDAWSNAVVRLRWKAEGLPLQIIPSKHLFPLALNDPGEKKSFHEVTLRGGSTLAGKILAADTKRITLQTENGKIIIPTPAVGYLKFAHSWGTQLGPALSKKKPGVALLNRDYAEGDFKEFKAGVATMESVLFGQQSIQQAELRAIKLADHGLKAPKFWVMTSSDTRIFANKIETLKDDRIKIQDNTGYHLILPAAQIRQVRVRIVPTKPEKE